MGQPGFNKTCMLDLWCTITRYINKYTHFTREYIVCVCVRNCAELMKFKCFKLVWKATRAASPLLAIEEE